MIKVVTEREHKVAIATQGKKRVAHHFRTAPLFLVYTIREGKLAATETRTNTHATTPETGEGSGECWKLMDDTLDDVRVLICSGMGENAYVGLLKRNILPLLTDEENTDRALEAYLHGRLKEHPEMVHGIARHSDEDNESTSGPPKRGKESETK